MSFHKQDRECLVTPPRSEGSLSMGPEMLRFAQHDNSGCGCESSLWPWGLDALIASAGLAPYMLAPRYIGDTCSLHRHYERDKSALHDARAEAHETPSTKSVRSRRGVVRVSERETTSSA
jgi:hypothetical protein